MCADYEVLPVCFIDGVFALISSVFRHLVCVYYKKCSYGDWLCIISNLISAKPLKLRAKLIRVINMSGNGDGDANRKRRRTTPDPTSDSNTAELIEKRLKYEVPVVNDEDSIPRLVV